MPRKNKEDSSFGLRLATLRKAGRQATKTTQRSVVVVLARALQVSADELLGLNAPPKTATAASDGDADTRAAITAPRQGERNGC